MKTRPTQSQVLPIGLTRHISHALASPSEASLPPSGNPDGIKYHIIVTVGQPGVPSERSGHKLRAFHKPQTLLISNVRRAEPVLPLPRTTPSAWLLRFSLGAGRVVVDRSPDCLLILSEHAWPVNLRLPVPPSRTICLH